MFYNNGYCDKLTQNYIGGHGTSFLKYLILYLYYLLVLKQLIEENKYSDQLIVSAMLGLQLISSAQISQAFEKICSLQVNRT